MSWQDELAQLDSALASGQISADEYRMRRDRVIAQASGQSAPEQPQQQGAEPTAVFRPVQPQQGFEDRTQIVPGHDRTQVVGGRQDADSTQIVPNMPQPQFPPAQAPPPWETHQPQQPNMAPPPWANEELPPEFGQQSWPRQGPEVFEEKSSGGSGKTVGIIIAVVLVLALAGGAVWFFGFRDKGNDQANPGGDGTSQEQSEPQPPTSTSEEPKLPEGPFIELPGEEVLNITVPIADAVTNNMPTPQEAPLLRDNGVTEVGALITEDDDKLRRGIWAFKLGPDAEPANVLTAMDQLYQNAEFELVGDQGGVLVRKKAAAQNPANDEEKLTVFRAHYLTDDGYMVRVEVYGEDSANVESTFEEILQEETDKFPAVS